MAAVTQNGYVLKFIANPSEAVRLAAVTDTGYAIEFIRNPGEKLQLIAVAYHRACYALIKGTPTDAAKALQQLLYGSPPTPKERVHAINRKLREQNNLNRKPK